MTFTKPCFFQSSQLTLRQEEHREAFFPSPSLQQQPSFREQGRKAAAQGMFQTGKKGFSERVAGAGEAGVF